MSCRFANCRVAASAISRIFPGSISSSRYINTCRYPTQRIEGLDCLGRIYHGLRGLHRSIPAEHFLETLRNALMQCPRSPGIRAILIASIGKASISWLLQNFRHGFVGEIAYFQRALDALAIGRLDSCRAGRIKPSSSLCIPRPAVSRPWFRCRRRMLMFAEGRAERPSSSVLK